MVAGQIRFIMETRAMMRCGGISPSTVLFYDPHQREVIDYVGGQADLAAGVLQTIGDPVQRFGEDRLRMLRAIRFSTTLQFRMHAGTLAAIQQHADDMSGVSVENGLVQKCGVFWFSPRLRGFASNAGQRHSSRRST